MVGDQPLALSSVGYTELLLGFYREQDPQRRAKRERFFQHLLSVVAIKPYTVDLSNLAGRIGGEQASIGMVIPVVDLMIGVTAISLNFSVLTSNLRHFRLIPGLDGIPF